MSARARVRRRVLLGGIAILAGALALAAHAFGVLEGLELSSVDARFGLRGERKPPDDIVIVALDDVTFSDLGRRPGPLPRSTHARVIDRLHRDGAELVAYDITFTGKTSPRQDRALLSAIQRSGPVLLATSKRTATGEAAITWGADTVRRAGGHIGATGITPDSDGELRRIDYALEGIPTFAVEAAGFPLASERFDQPAWIDFRGGPSTFGVYSLSDVLAGRLKRDTFEGKTVIVGATDPVLQDRHPTPPRGELMAGPEIQANAIATVREGLPLKDVPSWVNAVLALVLACAAPALALRFGLLATAASSIVVLAAFLVVAQLAFNAGHIIDVTYPLLALAIGASGTFAVDYLSVSAERRRTRNLFTRFAPADTVDQLLQRADDDLRLGGTELDATVLFADLRGFTAFAELLPAAQVLDVLNHYLEHMSEAIREFGGTVVSYMGDGIMAVFGAPIEQPDHADRALRAAKQMIQRRLPAFNGWLNDHGLEHEFSMGIGLASGPVMSGNVGSEWRLEYAAVGDTTNLAARLEALAKDSGHSILVSASTRARLASQDKLIEVGERSIPGRQTPHVVWAVDSSFPR